MNTLYRLRDLKYRYLPELVGRTAIVPSIGRIEGSVLASVSDVVAENFRLEDSIDNLTLMMWKYGFLDVTFASSQDQLSTADKITRLRMHELGLSSRPDAAVANLEPLTEEDSASDPDCLELLIEDIRQRGCVLRLFLTSKWTEGALTRAAEQSGNDSSGQTFASKINEWFPVTFTIEDACLSNSGAIWLAKHCYL